MEVMTLMRKCYLFTFITLDILLSCCSPAHVDAFLSNVNESYECLSAVGN